MSNSIKEDKNVKTLILYSEDDTQCLAAQLATLPLSGSVWLAGDLGVSLPILSRWVRDVIDQSPFGDVLETLHDQVGALRKENAALQRMLFARGALPDADGID